VAVRFIAAGGIMALVVTCRGGSMRCSRRELLSCGIVGCLLPGGNALLFFAEQRVATGLSSLIVASVPLWVVVLQLTRRESLATGTLVGVAVGFAGVGLLAKPSGGASGLGIGLLVLSALMWSAGSVFSRSLPMPANPFTATAWEMIAGGLALLPIGAATAGSFAPSWGSVGAWLYLVTFGSVIGYTAYTWLLANAPLGLVSTYAYVNPIVAIALGVLFRHEHVTWRLLAGAVIVVAAVALVVRREPAVQPADG
jgi:drug/metabolite transporter (DMT)-like permease